MINPFEPIEGKLNSIITMLNDYLYSAEPQKVREPNDELMTVEQAADFLKLKKTTVYSLISKGDIPVMKRSKRCYFSKDELIDYLKQGRKKTLTDIAKDAEQFLKTKKG
jgi:excisionase family DNA binding protein